MTRHEARIAVFELIFESLFRTDDLPEMIYSSAASDRGFASNEYVRNTYLGTAENSGDIDKTIAEYATNWKVERMSKTAKSILRLAVYELLYSDVPPKVAINEAIEIAKEFADEAEASFVNGILNKIAKEKGAIVSEAPSSGTTSDK